MIIPILKIAYDLNNKDLATNYNLAYILNYFGESDLALRYLSKLNVTNDLIEKLIIDIKGN